MEIHIHANSPVLFVDCSYYVFYRYFATLRWYSLQKMHGISKDELAEIASEIHKDDAFLAAFVKHVRQDIRKWQKHWGVPHGNIVFGFDCKRGSIWRHALHDAYKDSRTTSSSFNGNIFPFFYKWFDENKESLGVTHVEAECLEADDVIYLAMQSVLGACGGSTQIVIITNDNDYLQARQDGRVNIFNAQLQNIAERSSIGTPEQDLLYKILLGDSSDNIQGVAPKIGPVTAKKLALQGREAVEDWALKKGCMDRFLENERLISFQHIPEDLCKAFRDRYHWVFV